MWTVIEIILYIYSYRNYERLYSIDIDILQRPTRASIIFYININRIKLFKCFRKI